MFILSLSPQIQAWSYSLQAANSKEVADYKALSQNVMYASMEITDQFYSVLQDEEVKARIDSLNQNLQGIEADSELLGLLDEFLAWKRKIESK